MSSCSLNLFRFIKLRFAASLLFSSGIFVDCFMFNTCMSRSMLARNILRPIATKRAPRSVRRWVQTSEKGGEIFIHNEQDALVDLDMTRLKDTVSRIRSELGYDRYSVTLVLVDDVEMQKVNFETRNVDSPTDILSFPFHPSVTPGVLVEPEFENIPDLFTLGDMMLDVPYVIRRCRQDETEKIEDDDERGVSGAMARVYNPETRVHMLMVHGMLHLVGYDHIEDEDYEVMVAKEEELLEKLGLPTQR